MKQTLGVRLKACSAMPTLKLSCPACGRHLQVPDESVFGKKVKCRQCRKTFIAKAGNLLPPDASSHNDETFVASLGGSTYAAASGQGPLPLTDSQLKDGATLAVERRRIGQYLLLEPLGQGSMGTVFKALHCRLQKTVAVKVLVEELTLDTRALARFDREMVAVGQLSHPHIVQALDAGEAGGVHYLVTEYLEGTDLRKRVGSKGGLPVLEACELIRQAALGLQHAHERGLVHRDIKPSNLFVTVDNTVKLLDLGLARRPDDPKPRGGEVTTDGQCVGTPDYMAPEQWTDPRNVDPRADVYGLGCTLFFALVGHAPYAVEADSVAGKMMAHLKSDVPDVQALRAGDPRRPGEARAADSWPNRRPTGRPPPGKSPARSSRSAKRKRWSRSRLSRSRSSLRSSLRRRRHQPSRVSILLACDRNPTRGSAFRPSPHPAPRDRPFRLSPSRSPCRSKPIRFRMTRGRLRRTTFCGASSVWRSPQLRWSA